MLEIIKRLFKREDKAIPEEVVSDYPSGEMSISWDGETGNFCIKMNVEESDEGTQRNQPLRSLVLLLFWQGFFQLGISPKKFFRQVSMQNKKNRTPLP
jgi:hypothetical protein